MPETGILGAIPSFTWLQWGGLILVMGFVILLLRWFGSLVKTALDEFKQYRSEKNKEIEDQRTWQEEQGAKRDAMSEAQLATMMRFQSELTTKTHEFMSALQKEQQRAFDVLNQSIQVVNQNIQLSDKKLDMLLNEIGKHDEYSRKAIEEVRQENNTLHPPRMPTARRNTK
jgi:DNA anti-recombination protein RmuC